MQSDRELLEFAAKAAGIQIEWKNAVPYTGTKSYMPRAWLPLADDGDALRLAVKLELHVLRGIAQTPDGDMHFDIDERDQYAATRRAIVRAAAAIGKDMK